MPSSKHAAYSMVEIIVVIATIAILSIIVIPSYYSYVARTRVLDGIKALEEYKAIANSLYITTGETSIDPYYVLFTDQDTTGYVSGTAGGNAAVKSVDYEYVDQIEAYRPSTGSSYILIGARLITDAKTITSGNNYVYISGTPDSNGAIQWLCGRSTSKANSVSVDLLPDSCQATVP